MTALCFGDISQKQFVCNHEAGKVKSASALNNKWSFTQETAMHACEKQS